MGRAERTTLPEQSHAFISGFHQNLFSEPRSPKGSMGPTKLTQPKNEEKADLKTVEAIFDA